MLVQRIGKSETGWEHQDCANAALTLLPGWKALGQRETVLFELESCARALVVQLVPPQCWARGGGSQCPMPWGCEEQADPCEKSGGETVQGGFSASLRPAETQATELSSANDKLNT